MPKNVSKLVDSMQTGPFQCKYTSTKNSDTMLCYYIMV